MSKKGANKLKGSTTLAAESHNQSPQNNHLPDPPLTMNAGNTSNLFSLLRGCLCAPTAPGWDRGMALQVLLPCFSCIAPFYSRSLQDEYDNGGSQTEAWHRRCPGFLAALIDLLLEAAFLAAPPSEAELKRSVRLEVPVARMMLRPRASTSSSRVLGDRTSESTTWFCAVSAGTVRW